jgi:hypothetical protein
MTSTIPFNRGDDLQVGFLFKDASGSIIDITGFDVTAEVRWRSRTRLTLTIGDGVTILDPIPDTNPDDQLPHGVIALSEEQTATLPLGAVAHVHLVLSANGDTVSSYPIQLEGLE